ncbi:Vgb family protein [Granulicella aggregans]|jgi:streptogramin lyase|uniref:Vgb family protein n=1 Tax=Granulicella aggregans TaxID=474949 RepID=UPI0021DF7F30|nr:hypothetical protein [Granulicella aggregans]
MASISTKGRNLVLLASAILTATAAMAQQPAPKPQGLPAVSRPLSELKPTNVYQVAGSPDWKVMAKDSVWVTSARANHVVQLLPGSEKTGIVVDVPKPCSSLAYGWNSIWIPSCGAKKLLRVDETTGKTLAEIPADPANSEGGITTGLGAVYIVVKPSTLLKVDPETNTVVAKLDLPSDSENPFFGNGFVWVTSFGHNALLKVDPQSMKLVANIPIGPKPRFLTVGAGSVWALNQGDGTVSRVDMASGKLVATIECGLTGEGGEITFGAGSAWATLFNIPLTQIDASTNKAVKQWAGKGGDGLQFGFGSLWLSNLAQQTVWRISPDQK